MLSHIHTVCERYKVQFICMYRCTLYVQYVCVCVWLHFLYNTDMMLYSSTICPTSLLYLSVLPLCSTSLLYLSALPLCPTSLPYLSALPLCSTSLLYLSALPLCSTSLLYLSALPLCSTSLLYLSALPLCSTSLELCRFLMIVHQKWPPSTSWYWLQLVKLGLTSTHPLSTSLCGQVTTHMGVFNSTVRCRCQLTKQWVWSMYLFRESLGQLVC